MLGSSGDEGPCSTLGWKSKAIPAAKVKKILFAEKRKERPHGVMQQNLEIGGPPGGVGHQVL
jgi:hypothetical protein